MNVRHTDAKAAGQFTRNTWHHHKPRRRTSRHTSPPRPQWPKHPQTPEQTMLFLEWIDQRQCDLSMSYIKTATRQNQVALHLASVQNQLCRQRKTDLQQLPVATTRRTRELLDQWNALDAQMRWLRHMERLLSPLYFLSCTGKYEKTPDEIPMGDPLIESLWMEALRDSRILRLKVEGREFA